MRKIISIGLLLVFIFNLGGYYAVYWFLNYRAAIEMNRRLDSSNYSQEETVTIKIPMSIPYYFDQKDYERMEGSYEQNGEFFKLVKKKFELDTLYIVSIKDHKKKMLFDSLADFVKLSNNVPTSSQQTLKLLGNFTKDFTCNTKTEILRPSGWCQEPACPRQLFDILTSDTPVFSPPPELFHQSS